MTDFKEIQKNFNDAEEQINEAKEEFDTLKILFNNSIKDFQVVERNFEEFIKENKEEELHDILKAMFCELKEAINFTVSRPIKTYTEKFNSKIRIYRSKIKALDESFNSMNEIMKEASYGQG